MRLSALKIWEAHNKKRVYNAQEIHDSTEYGYTLIRNMF
jgi:hypothetical protein